MCNNWPTRKTSLTTANNIFESDNTGSSITICLLDNRMKVAHNYSS